MKKRLVIFTLLIALLMTMTAEALAATNDSDENCSRCAGTGKIKCSACNGSGKSSTRTTCSACKGKGTKEEIVECPGCKYKTSSRGCKICSGKGLVRVVDKTCSRCDRKGYLESTSTCKKCAGTGKVECPLLTSGNGHKSNTQKNSKTYTASARGISSDVIVKLTFNGDKITEVFVDVSGETPGIGAATGDTLVAQIMEAQNTEIEGVSGATVTSTATKKALKKCFEQKEANQNNTVVSARETVRADGIYEGIGKGGMGGDIKITVTINDGQIDAIEFKANETPGIGADALDEMVKQAVLNDGVFDAVSGATMTSTAFADAMADALSKATK